MDLARPWSLQSAFVETTGTDLEYSARILAEGCAPRDLGRPHIFHVFVAGPNKHDNLLVSHVPTKREILTTTETDVSVSLCDS